MKTSSLLTLAGGLRREHNDPGALVVAGSRELVPVLARELRAGGDPTAVREDGPLDGAVALVWIGPPDEVVLRDANRRKLPIVGVTDGQSLPYVLDTDLIKVRGGQGFPVGEIATVLAGRLGAQGTGLAARLPVLRGAVVSSLIRSSSRRNALIAAGIFVPGVEMPVLTYNQLRLVMRIARAHGHDVDPWRTPELLGVVGAGLGWRTLARSLLDFVPVAGWAIKSGTAYTGTRAAGEAARRYYGAKSP